MADGLNCGAKLSETRRGNCRKLKLAQYFLHILQRPDRAKNKMEWTEQTINNLVYMEVQANGRIRMWTKIREADKLLRVILLAD